MMDDKTLNHTLNQTLKQTLTERAQHTIPDDYDLWSQIQEAVDSQEEDPMKVAHLRIAPSNPRRTRRLIYVLVAALLLTTTAVYGVYQTQQPTGDQGIEAIQAEGYTTDLTLVQRKGDVEVQLDWGYIDSSRTVISYQIFAVYPDGTRSTDHIYGIYRALLRNKEGLFAERRATSETSNQIKAGIPTRSQGELIYSHSQEIDPSAMPDVMSFELEVTIVEARLSPRMALQAMLRSTLSNQEGHMLAPHYFFKWPEMTDPDAAPDPRFNIWEPMVFEFQLPVQRSGTVEANQSVEVNGTTGILRDLVITPSRIELTLCFTVPKDSPAWMPHAKTLLDGQMLRAGGQVSTPPDENGLTCTVETINAYAAPGATLNIHVAAIDTEPHWGWDRDPQLVYDLQQQFAERGVHIDVFVDADGFVGYSWPSGSTPEERAALIDLGFLIEGPWEFTVQIPES